VTVPECGDCGAKLEFACEPKRLSSRQPDNIEGESYMIRKAKAVWRGTGRAGSGHRSTDSGVLSETAYSFRTRFEFEKGTNP